MSFKIGVMVDSFRLEIKEEKDNEVYQISFHRS